ncbi:MAG TPA: lysophospholipid acyltransferase family protein [Arenimonas sp.]|uniref:lysophospholipid acyltransferase family protein n=1 Tax=Arenimonas sp. TaxID=1872635 RepID=UPI002D7F5533|nr:lysophospholipid acyltransferase family protein [Arenimonas sp.]HEU0152915.1 lysophospholipid acyltransferase family protein [Arenimonas sp.]
MRCRLLTAPLQATAALVARLPQRALLALGRALAWLGRPLLRSRRRIAAINVALCFPALEAKAQRRLADATVADTVVGALEMLRAWHAPAGRLRGLAEVEGLEHVKAALAAGRGVLLLTGHFTSYELALRLLGEALGRPVRLVARDHNHACLQAWIEASRRRVSGPTLPKKRGREPLLAALRAGEVVGYLADQDFSYRHVFVPFFGVPAATLAGVPGLVQASGAIALPLQVRRGEDGRYRLRIEPAWPDWPSGDEGRDAARYLAWLEAAVRDAPSQYLWVHRRFKTRPPGEPPLY